MSEIKTETIAVEDTPIVESPKKRKKKKGLGFYLLLALCLIFGGSIGAQAINENYLISSGTKYEINIKMFEPDDKISVTYFLKVSK